MKNILLVGDKWCDGKIEIGESPSCPTYIKSLSEVFSDVIVHTLFYDESFTVYHKHIDSIVLDYLQKYPVDIVIFTMMGATPMLPSASLFQSLKKTNIPVYTIFSDTGPGWGLQTINSIGNHATKHISVDFPSYPCGFDFPKRDNQIYLWTPMDKDIYFKPDKKDVEVSFIGSTRYCGREQILRVVKSEVPNLIIDGGQRESRLTPEECAQKIRRSYIIINFAQSPGMFHQVKGRVCETISTGGLLLESQNSSTSRLLKAGIEYVEFNTIQDLIDKIKYFCSHEKERDEIANNGHQAFQTRMNNQIFWDNIFK